MEKLVEKDSVKIWNLQLTFRIVLSFDRQHILTHVMTNSSSIVGNFLCIVITLIVYLLVEIDFVVIQFYPAVEMDHRSVVAIQTSCVQ